MSWFKETLKGLGFETYDDYLQGKHWLEFKRKYMASDRKKQCSVCGATRIQLHHHTYKRLGNEWLSDVTPLCRTHHEAVHTWLKENNKYVRHTSEAIGAIRGPQPVSVPSVPRQRKKKKKIKKRIRRCSTCKNWAGRKHTQCGACRKQKPLRIPVSSASLSFQKAHNQKRLEAERILREWRSKMTGVPLWLRDITPK